MLGVPKADTCAILKHVQIVIYAASFSPCPNSNVDNKTPDWINGRVGSAIELGSQKRRFRAMYKDTFNGSSFPSFIEGRVIRHILSVKATNPRQMSGRVALLYSRNDSRFTIGTHL